MSDTSYNTNLAAEFHVMSVLHRLGADAALSLGNKKSVDITVVRGEGDTITVDVKGLAGTTSWPVDNVKDAKQNHYLVFICYRGKIGDPSIAPDAWVVPSTELAPLIYHSPNGRRKVVSLGSLKKHDLKYRENWEALVRA